jgi:hypothetical protein
LCRDERREKFEALVQKEREVHAYLDAADAEKADLREEIANLSARIRHEVQLQAKLQVMGEGAAPDATKLQDLQRTLEYKETQAKNSEETSVRAHRLQLPVV